MARDISNHKDQIEFHLQRLEQEYNSRQVRTRRSRKLRNCFISIPLLNVEREQRRLQSEELKDIHTRLMETMEGDSDSENEGEKENKVSRSPLKENRDITEDSPNIQEAADCGSDGEPENEVSLATAENIKEEYIEPEVKIERSEAEATAKAVRVKETPCVMCDKLFANRKQMMDHHRKQHRPKSSSKVFSCQTCDYECINQDKMRKHQKDFHGKNPDEVTCHWCWKVYVSRKKLTEHHKTVHVNLKLKCHSCEKVFPNKDRRNVHINRDHIQKRYTCEVCEKTFSNNANKKKHIEHSHGDVEPLKCTLCNYTCLYKSSLRYHVASIHSELPMEKFSCPVCNETYTKKDTVRVHIQTVHERVEFPCDTCSFVCFNKRNLKVHERIHTRGAREKCHICQKECYDMKNHINVVHIRKQFPCEYCPQIASSKGELKVHIKTKH